MKKYFITFFICILSFHPFFAEDDFIPKRPSPPRLVNNLSVEFPDFLSKQEESLLEEKLVRFNDSTSNQIAILIVDDIGDYDANEFGVKVFNSWGIGQESNNNGILILIKPTGNAGERVVYIVVGKGLEGAIPDITAKQIAEREIIPLFKNRDFYLALNNATDVIISLAKGEFNSSEYTKKNRQKQLPPLAVILIILVIVIVLISRSRNGGYSIGRRGYYGGGFFGGGFGSSGGGGGFGGFGGGSSGGGGAGGSW